MRIKKSFLLLALVLSTSACGEDTKNADTNATPSAEVTTESSSYAEDSDKGESNGDNNNIISIFPKQNEIYLDYLDAYKKVVIDKGEWDPSLELGGDPAFFTMDYYEDAGYYFLDLNDDGRDELLIGCTGSDWKGLIYVLYTYENGRVKKVLESYERSRYVLLADGLIRYEGSGGADNYLEEYYTFNRSAELVQTEPSESGTRDLVYIPFSIYPDFETTQYDDGPIRIDTLTETIPIDSGSRLIYESAYYKEFPNYFPDIFDYMQHHQTIYRLFFRDVGYTPRIMYAFQYGDQHVTFSVPDIPDYMRMYAEDNHYNYLLVTVEHSQNGTTLPNLVFYDGEIEYELEKGLGVGYILNRPGVGYIYINETLNSHVFFQFAPRINSDSIWFSTETIIDPRQYTDRENVLATLGYSKDYTPISSAEFSPETFYISEAEWNNCEQIINRRNAIYGLTYDDIIQDHVDMLNDFNNIFE